MSPERAPAHPGVAAVLSFVFSGLGQIYNGQIRKGLWFVALATLGLTIVLLGASVIATGLQYNFLNLKIAIASLAAIALGGFLVCWVGIRSIYDAYANAAK